jgi:hypothetical protein
MRARTAFQNERWANPMVKSQPMNQIGPAVAALSTCLHFSFFLSHKNLHSFYLSFYLCY